MIDIQQFAEALIKQLGRSRGTRDRANVYASRVTDVAQAIAGANYDRTKLIIQNLSASDIEIGDKDLAIGQGIEIAANGGAYIDDVAPYLGEWWAVSAAAGPLDVRVRDES